MTEHRKARTRRKQDDTSPSDEQPRKDSGQQDPGQEDEARNENGEAHTELVPAGEGPRPRAKVLPPEISEDDEEGDSDDDLFNDMPV